MSDFLTIRSITKQKCSDHGYYCRPIYGCDPRLLPPKISRKRRRPIRRDACAPAITIPLYRSMWGIWDLCSISQAHLAWRMST